MESILVFLLFLLGATLVYYSKIIPYYLWKDPKDLNPYWKVLFLCALIVWFIAFVLMVYYYLNVFGMKSEMANPFKS